MTTQDTPIESCLVRVHGRVQGVGFREACIEQARALGVTGWVRNRFDGTVEAMLQGHADRLQQMRRWMRAGPPGSRVDELVVTPVEPAAPQFERFQRRPTE